MGSALQAKVVMAKLFPKLVSSLAVLLLLCQFGYVACQPTGFSNSSRYLPDGEGTHARYISFSNYIQKKEENLFIC
jgi:hypothetical protein